MNWIDYLQAAVSILTILGMGYLVVKAMIVPQKDEDKKASLLAQQIQWEKEATAERFKNMQESSELRFSQMQDTNKDLLLQSNNHIHTVDTKVDAMGQTMLTLTKELVRLGTIIDERIPKK
jgi:hypothetical protein